MNAGYEASVCMCHDDSHCYSCYTQRGETALDTAKDWDKHDVVTYLEGIGEWDILAIIYNYIKIVAMNKFFDFAFANAYSLVLLH